MSYVLCLILPSFRVDQDLDHINLDSLQYVAQKYGTTNADGKCGSNPRKRKIYIQISNGTWLMTMTEVLLMPTS